MKQIRENTDIIVDTLNSDRRHISLNVALALLMVFPIYLSGYAFYLYLESQHCDLGRRKSIMIPFHSLCNTAPSDWRQHLEDFYLKKMTKMQLRKSFDRKKMIQKLIEFLLDNLNVDDLNPRAFQYISNIDKTKITWIKNQLRMIHKTPITQYIPGFQRIASDSRYLSGDAFYRILFGRMKFPNVEILRNRIDTFVEHQIDSIIDGRLPTPRERKLLRLYLQAWTLHFEVLFLTSQSRWLIQNVFYHESKTKAYLSKIYNGLFVDRKLLRKLNVMGEPLFKKTFTKYGAAIFRNNHTDENIHYRCSGYDGNPFVEREKFGSKLDSQHYRLYTLARHVLGDFDAIYYDLNQTFELPSCEFTFECESGLCEAVLEFIEGHMYKWDQCMTRFKQWIIDVHNISDCESIGLGHPTKPFPEYSSQSLSLRKTYADKFELLELKAKERQQNRTHIFEEELIQKVWHPESPMFKWHLEHEDV